MKKIILVSLLVANACIPAKAVVLALYDFESSTGRYNSVDGNALSTAGTISQSGLTLGFGTTASQTGMRFSASDIAYNNVNYFAFTLSAASGYTLNLSGATLTLNSLVTTTAPGFNYTVLSSANNYGAAIGSATPSPANTWTSPEYTLSGSQYNNLTTITFRINVDDATFQTSTSQYLYFDNIMLDGATPVPEPTTIAGGIFCGLFVAGAFGRRLLKNRQS